MGVLGVSLSPRGDGPERGGEGCKDSTNQGNGHCRNLVTCGDAQVTSSQVMGNKILDVSRGFQADHTARVQDIQENIAKHNSLPLHSDEEHSPSNDVRKSGPLAPTHQNAPESAAAVNNASSESEGNSDIHLQDKVAGGRPKLNKTSQTQVRELRLSLRHGSATSLVMEYVCLLRTHLLQAISGRTHFKSPTIGTPHVDSFFTRGANIGRGHAGIVTLCEEKGSREKFACKTILKKNIKRPEDVDEICLEILTMLRLPSSLDRTDQERFVRLHEIFEDEESIHLVMDYCVGGDLFDYILSRKRLAEKEAADIIRQIAEAVRFMHLQGYVHRDLKPENILLLGTRNPGKSVHPKIKLADFGLSVHLLPGQAAKGAAGSPFYMSPEVVTGKTYGPKVDVWSMGVILYACLSGHLPFWGATKDEVFQKVVEGKINFKKRPWPLVSLEAKHLICGMLHPDPAKRYPTSGFE